MLGLAADKTLTELFAVVWVGAWVVVLVAECTRDLANHMPAYDRRERHAILGVWPGTLYGDGGLCCVFVTSFVSYRHKVTGRSGGARPGQRHQAAEAVGLQ